MRSFVLVFAVTVSGLFLLIAVPAVHAQTMGEYGMQTGASAANAQNAGSALGSAIKRGARLPAARSQPSGGSHTVMIPSGNDEGENPSHARTEKKSDSARTDKSSNSSAAPWKGNWVRVR